MSRKYPSSVIEAHMLGFCPSKLYERTTFRVGLKMDRGGSIFNPILSQILGHFYSPWALINYANLQMFFFFNLLTSYVFVDIFYNLIKHVFLRYLSK